MNTVRVGDFVNRCDWEECNELGLFDGVATDLLNGEGHKNVRIDEKRARFVYLRPKHFELGVGGPGSKGNASQKTDGTRL